MESGNKDLYLLVIVNVRNNCGTAARYMRNENHFVNFTGATFALVTFRLACIRVVYINKFVAQCESLFYHKYSFEKKIVIPEDLFQ